MLKLTTEEFIQKAIVIHGNKYNYSKVDYKKSSEKVKIICPIHGEFEQRPNNHLQGKICNICGNVYQDKNIFIFKASQIHNNFYDYSLVEYKNCRTKIKIICPIHGEFEQRPNDHLNQKSGCPICNFSKGELQIKNWLQERDIRFETQKRFSDCKFKKPLPFDFYLPDHNICIEFDGRQHFYPESFSSDRSKETKLENLKIIQHRDSIKNNYCNLNNINLIRLIYTENLYDSLNKKLLPYI